MDGWRMAMKDGIVTVEQPEQERRPTFYTCVEEGAILVEMACVLCLHLLLWRPASQSSIPARTISRPLTFPGCHSWRPPDSHTELSDPDVTLQAKGSMALTRYQAPVTDFKSK